MEDELTLIEQDILEIHAMIDHFISLKERGVEWATDEIAIWRRDLQRAKLYKRRLQGT